MAISDNKAIVRIVEVLALSVGVASFTAGALVRAGVLRPSNLQPWLWYTFTALPLIWGIYLWLISEYSSIKRPRKSWFDATGKLSWSEARELEQWCPKWLKYSSYFLAFLALASGMEIGGVKWSVGDPFTEREAIGFSHGLAIFCFVAVPCLASASRAPGGFEDIFNSDQSEKCI